MSKSGQHRRKSDKGILTPALLIIPYRGCLNIDTFHPLHPSTVHHEEKKYLQLQRYGNELDDDKMKPLVLQAIDYLVITYFEM